MRNLRTLSVLAIMLVAAATAHAQAQQPLILVLEATGPITPPMAEYIGRGIQVAERRGAEAVLIRLDTPGGSIDSMKTIVQAMRASGVPVIVYVAPNGAQAASAGAPITAAAHASAMAPETIIGAASVVGSGGVDLGETMKAKSFEDMKATMRSLLERRGTEAVRLGEAMVDDAKAVSASEALDAGLIDFVASSQAELLEDLDGFKVEMPDGRRALNTSGAVAEPLGMSLIEELLLIITDPNIVFILLSLGVLALQVELTHPGTWVPGFIGVVCLALAIYGIGVLPVNYFGLVFIATAFVLFILDIKAPTHGALMTAGVASFIIGALVLFNSPGVPAFERVSVPLVIAVGAAIGLMFGAVLAFALRAMRIPIQMGSETMLDKIGTARSDIGTSGQVQVESELWTASAAPDSESIRKGDRVKVVDVRGVHLTVRKV